ncbi:MAG: PAS domain S-box protein, partial [Acidobacteriota bacterium]|nr:PAS domain S-box protein [Acidobacteriota bacterium]
MARLAGWSIDAKTEMLEWSDALFDILGFEVEGPPTLEESLLKYCGDSSARMATALRRCLTTGESFDEVAMIETGTGDVWDVRVMGEAVRDENGDIVRVVGALYDITALVQQSREVERLERRMTETMNGLQYPLIFVRRDWVVEWANDAACTLFERPRHEVDGASVYTLFPDFEQTQSYTTYLHAMNEGVYSETTVFDPRRQRFFDVSVLPAPDGIVVAVRDVTAEEEAKTVAEESTARANLLAQMVDRSKEAMIIRDFQRGVTYWNRSAEELYGWSHEEALRRPLLELFYDDPEEARRALAIVERDGYWTGEIEQLTKSGAKITVEGRWQLIRDAEGNATGVFGVNRDVTGAKLERELRARNQRMESIGTLASGMAHDLNNVLTPVLLTLEVLNRDQSDPSKRRLIESMEASVKRGADMIRQVLAYARGVEGERDVVDLALVVDEALRLTRDVLPRNIDVQHHADSPVWSVMGDATQLMQVVVNLIINARDAMPNGGVLEIGVRNGYGSDAGRIATDLDGQYFVYVDVVDTGVGIEANALSRVFEPFFTTKPVGAGTGLGLSTSQAIAKSHGGRLDVSSTPGRGTRFTLILPAEVMKTVPV